MKTLVEKVLILKKTELFSRIPGESLARVAEIAREESFAEGDVLMKQDEPGDSLFIIVHGEVSVQTDGREVARLGAGECIGEMSLLDAEVRSATVVSLSEVDVMKIEQEDFFELISEREEISRGLVAMLTHRLRMSDKKRAAD